MAKRDTNTTTATISDVSIETPAELAAGTALLTRFSAFVAGAPTRSKITAADIVEMDEIVSLSAEYSTAAHDAWAQMKWGDTKAPDAVSTLHALIQNYRFDCLDEQVISLASSRTKNFAAVESATYRGHLANEGASIVQQIEAAIECGRRRLVNAREIEQRLTDNVRYWLGTTHPTVRQTIAALVSTIAEYPEMMGHRNGLLQSLRNQQVAITLEAEREGVAITPLFAHDWRNWLPIAGRVLAEDSKQVAA